MTKIQVLLIAFFLWGCRKKDLPVVNSCIPDQSFEAGFQMSDSYYSGHFADTDTIINFRASFRADSIYTSYKWIVGNHADTIKTRNFSLLFSIAELGKTLPIQLIATGAKNPCNPNDDGIDTVNRTLTIMYLAGLDNEAFYPLQTVIKAPYLGKWHGSFKDNPTDTFTMFINNNGRAPGGVSIATFYGFRVYNLPKGPTFKWESRNPLISTCVNINPNEDILKYFGYEISEIGFNGFYIERAPSGCKPNAEMWGFFDSKIQKIYVSCSIDTTINGVVSKRNRFFEGKKVL